MKIVNLIKQKLNKKGEVDINFVIPICGFLVSVIILCAVFYKETQIKERKQEYHPYTNLYFDVAKGSTRYSQDEIDDYNEWFIDEKKKAVDGKLFKFQENLLLQLDFLSSDKEAN